MKKNKKNKPNKIIRTYIQQIWNEVQTIHSFLQQTIIEPIKQDKIHHTKKILSLQKDKKDFINEIVILKSKLLLSENSFDYLKELVIKLADENSLLTTPEQKIIELEIANRKILDWQKSRFNSNKENLKERTKLKISNLFEDYDDYMWKWKLTSFSELKHLSNTLSKKI